MLNVTFPRRDRLPGLVLLPECNTGAKMANLQVAYSAAMMRYAHGSDPHGLNVSIVISSLVEAYAIIFSLCFNLRPYKRLIAVRMLYPTGTIVRSAYKELYRPHKH